MGQVVGESHVGDKSQGFISISALAGSLLDLGDGPEAAVSSVIGKGRMKLCLPVAGKTPRVRGLGGPAFQLLFPEGS